MASFLVYDLSSGQVLGKYSLSHERDLPDAILAHTTPSQRALVIDESASPVTDTAGLVVREGVLTRRRRVTIQISGGVAQTIPSSFSGTLLTFSSRGVQGAVTVAYGAVVLPDDTTSVYVDPTDPDFYSLPVSI